MRGVGKHVDDRQESVKVIVGLGNPGRRYRSTPHSVGFEVLDELGRRLGVRLRSSFRFNARLCRAVVDGNDLLLMTPQTYMNNSGTVVAAVLPSMRTFSALMPRGKEALISPMEMLKPVARLKLAAIDSFSTS